MMEPIQTQSVAGDGNRCMRMLLRLVSSRCRGAHASLSPVSLLMDVVATCTARRQWNLSVF